jgi:hypothetical protein
MAIEFHCPNGHRISCSEDRAGRAAKCPRCGALFRIPMPTANGHPAPADKAAADSTPAVDAAPADSIELSPEEVAPTRDELIVFLCPNGHKLNGPARLQGRAGQCPHCGAKFRIPSLEDSQGVDEVESHEEAEILEEEQQQLQELFRVVEAEEEQRHAHPATATAASTGEPVELVEAAAAVAPGQVHPLADLFVRLWEEREHGGVVELHLEGGAMIVPEWYDRNLSCRSHALFAMQAADGTLTMTIVPWDSVKRVVVRGVTGLPYGMFE